MDNKFRIKIMSLVFAILLVSTGCVLAFGISTPYWDDHPLEMYPGQTKEVAFNLQNCPSLREDCEEEDVDVIAVFEDGEEIAEIISGTEYNVLYGTANTNIILKVSIPEDADIGDSYNVAFYVTSPAEGDGGNIQLGVKYNIGFPVDVVEKPAEPGEPPSDVKGINWTLWIIVIIIIIIILIVIILLRKKREEAPVMGETPEIVK